MVVQEYKVKGKTEDVVADKVDMFIKINDLKAQNARMMTITARDLGTEVEVIYHFERGFDVVNLRLKTPKNEPIPSITGVFPAAFVAENELQDMFNLKILGINVDFEGRLMKIEGADETTLLKPAVGPVPFIKRFYGRCREECPAMVNAPKYIRQIVMGDSQGGYNTHIEQAPLPAILGRVCFAPCEEACRQEKNDEPIQIRLLKRFTADSMPSLRRGVKRAKLTGRKVAVVGGGPAGVSCAFYLGMMGHDITVFEKGEGCGGAMYWGIPKYKLPKNLMKAEISARFEEAGVDLKTNTEIKELKPLLEKFDAVFVGIGAVDSYKLGIEGEDSEGVIDFREILTTVNVRNGAVNVGDRVAVIGGGNSSIDAARTSRRLGATRIIIYYRRTEREMPASTKEIHGAIQEGVNIEYLTTPIKITPGKPLKLELQHMELGEADSSGRRRPIPIKGSEFTVEVDTVIKAIGQSVVIPEKFGLEVDRQGKIVINDSYETSMKGVWAGGDVCFGPRFVIEALRDGRKAASEIDKSFGGKGWPEPQLDQEEYVGRPMNLSEIHSMEHVQIRELDPEERIRNFNEVELGYDEDEALREAGRCWRCDWNE